MVTVVSVHIISISPKLCMVQIFFHSGHRRSPFCAIHTIRFLRHCPSARPTCRGECPALQYTNSMLSGRNLPSSFCKNQWGEYYTEQLIPGRYDMVRCNCPPLLRTCCTVCMVNACNAYHIAISNSDPGLGRTSASEAKIMYETYHTRIL